MDPTIKQAVEARRVEVRGHVARQVDAAMLEDADLVLAFEGSHRDWILSESPKAVRKTFTIRSVASLLEVIPRRASPLTYLANMKTPPGGDLDFEDPYGRGPEVADRAVSDIESLLDIILPGVDALTRPSRFKSA